MHKFVGLLPSVRMLKPIPKWQAVVLHCEICNLPSDNIIHRYIKPLESGSNEEYGLWNAAKRLEREFIEAKKEYERLTGQPWIGY